jgi:cysteine-rich repeat protein
MILQTKKTSLCCFSLLAVASLAGCQLFIEASEAGLIENTESLCGDSVDNDDDGKIDCQDQECQALGFCEPQPNLGCGNGIVEAGEECDNRGIAGGDGCSAFCTLEDGCGDGDLDLALGEECDDNNLIAGDGCATNCLLEDQDTAFVLCNGAPTGDGSRAAPFSTITEALATTKGQIAVLAGSTCTESLNMTKDISIFGLGTQFSSIIDGGANSPIRIDTPDLKIRFSNLFFSSNQNSGTINLSGNASGTQLALLGVFIRNFSIDANATGFDCSPTAAAQVLLDQSALFLSPSGATRVRGACQFISSNSLWANNGSPTSTKGAIFVETPSTALLAVLQSTFTDNKTSAGINTVVTNTDPGQCTIDSVIAHNTNVDANNANLYFDADCAVSFSDSMSVVTPGTNNIIDDPLLDFNVPTFGELGVGSLARDAGNPTPEKIALPFEPAVLFGIDPFSHDFFGRPRFAPGHIGAQQTP